MSIVPSFSASKALSFFHTLSSFNWGEFGQGDGIHIHSIRIVVRARWEMCLGGDSSLMEGEDMHLLSMEDFSLVNPSLDHSRDGRHGKDHAGNLLIQSERELANEGEFLLHSRLHREVLEVGDILLESVVGFSILLLE